MIAKDVNNHTGGTEVKNAKAATCGADGEKKLTVTGRSDGATTAEFADYVISRL